METSSSILLKIWMKKANLR